METFTETSSEPYDRHHYRVWLRDGTYMDCEDFDDAKELWRVMHPKPITIEVTQPKGRAKGRATGF